MVKIVISTYFLTTILATFVDEQANSLLGPL